jgi:hypothetical protein
VPLGDPKLMWSFNREGECDQALIDNRTAAMGFDVERKRKERQSFLSIARPQRGVDAMAARFDGTTPIPGVVDIASKGE